ncbi:FecR family protein [Methyloradius palustris]|uniref:Peptide ABC transporter substrate-binding protein n=1 Tax=Methyloradius palustris TaxID=2778876 RepID=A0A8D5JQI5_9PROT|nr:FecR domain-containing protein [Methyloradius palustris]BCM24521.1 peptide ABC transporter substrate-binding protein [Methyloradius palustris]
MLSPAKKKTLRETAISWFIRLQKLDAEHPDRTKFEAWLMASPSHQQVYLEVEDIWQKLDSTPQLERLTSALQKKQQLQRSSKIKTAFTALSIVVLSAASLFGYQAWQSQPLMQMSASANIGEVAVKDLNDGSKITMNANTNIDIIYYRNKRLVKLNRGEAIFEVAKDPNRPFVVDSGDAKVTVLGTRFVVNRLNNLVRVSVDHGRVQVESQSQDGNVIGTPTILTNGEVAEVLPAQSPQRVSRPASDAFTFQQGIITFNNATLDEISETLSRYRQQPVHIESGLNVKTKVTAIVKARNVEKFLDSLPEVAPVKVEYGQNETLIVSPAKK